MRAGIRAVVVLTALMAASGVTWAQVPPDPKLEPVQVWVADPVTAPDEVVSVEGAGWEPGGEVQIAVDGQTLGAAGTDGDGRFSQTVRIPGDVAAGDLTLTVRGRDAAGQQTEFPISLQVGDSASPGIAGGVILAVVFGAIVLIAAAFLLIRRRRGPTLAEEAQEGRMPVRNPEPGAAPHPEDSEAGRR